MGSNDFFDLLDDSTSPEPPAPSSKHWLKMRFEEQQLYADLVCEAEEKGIMNASCMAVAGNPREESPECGQRAMWDDIGIDALRKPEVPIELPLVPVKITWEGGGVWDEEGADMWVQPVPESET